MYATAGMCTHCKQMCHCTHAQACHAPYWKLHSEVCDKYAGHCLCVRTGTENLSTAYVQSSQRLVGSHLQSSHLHVNKDGCAGVVECHHLTNRRTEIDAAIYAFGRRWVGGPGGSGEGRGKYRQRLIILKMVNSVCSPQHYSPPQRSPSTLLAVFTHNEQPHRAPRAQIPAADP